MVKTIETHYKGYRFRSRLEARWAVFFDAMGIDYEYEPEGFDLGDGIWYLPDFLLHFNDQEVYLEIKPKNYAEKIKNDFLKEKVHKFCMQTDKEIVLCMGMPDDYLLILRKANTQAFIDIYDSDIELQKRFPDRRPNFEIFLHKHPISFSALGADKFQKALHLARSARFEKG